MTAGLRWSRALILAAVALASAAVAHLLADGLLPGAPTLVVLWLASAAAMGRWLSRPAGPARIAALLVGGQFAMHAVFTAVAGHAGDAVSRAAVAVTLPPATLPAPAGARTGSLQDQYLDQLHAAGAPAGSGLAVPAWVQHLIADLSGPHALMALAHAGAAAAVGLWLASGERALWFLISLAADRWRCAAAWWGLAQGAQSRASRPRPAVAMRLPVPVLRSALLLGSAPRRGPPVPLLAA